MSLLKLPAMALVRPHAAAVATQNVKFRAQASVNDASTFELDVYDIVDPMGENYWWGTTFVSAKDVRAKLKQAGNVSQIVVRINSVGGDVFDGTAIYNLLKDHPARVSVHVDGICASIASIIAMAGDDITMGQGTWMMVHCPYSQVMLDARADDMRKAADTLDKMTDSMAAVYAERTGVDVKECIALMQEETWMTAEEALKQGFCTAINSVPLSTTPDIESEVDSEKVEAMVAELTRTYSRIPAGALNAMKTATHTYAIAAMAAASAAARPVAEGDDKEMKQLKEDKQMLQDEVTDLKKQLKKAEDDAAKAKEKAKAEEDEEDADDKAKAEFPKKKEDDDDDEESSSGDDKDGSKAEAQALARIGLKARALTGAASLREAEKELMKMVAKADQVEVMQAQMAHIRKDRHVAEVSRLIAEGSVLPSRKAYLLEGIAEAKDDKSLVKAVNECESRLAGWLSATGGEKLGPVLGQEHKQPSVPQIMTPDGKGVVTDEDRKIAKLTGGMTEEQLQAAADLRAKRFGNHSAA